MKMGPIETERLILRELLPTDDKAIFIFDSNTNVHKFLGNQPVSSIEESRKYISNIQEQYLDNGIGRFAVILKETDEFIGWAGLKYIREPENDHVNFFEIGYRFIEDYWRKGYGYEAAKAWLDYGFNTMKIKTIYASADRRNSGSRKILEKMGMQFKNEFDWNGIPCAWYEFDKKDNLK